MEVYELGFSFRKILKKVKHVVKRVIKTGKKIIKGAINTAAGVVGGAIGTAVSAVDAYVDQYSSYPSTATAPQPVQPYHQQPYHQPQLVVIQPSKSSKPSLTNKYLPWLAIGAGIFLLAKEK